MFTFANTELHRIALATVGAIVLTTACVGAAVGPAHAVHAGSVQVAAAADAGQVNA